MTALGGKRLSCDGNAGVALPPEADILTLDTNPELLADFGRIRTVGFRKGATDEPTSAWLMQRSPPVCVARSSEQRPSDQQAHGADRHHARRPEPDEPRRAAQAPWHQWYRAPARTLPRNSQ